MTLLKEFLERARDLVSADITQAQAGTDNTVPSENDSGLFTPVPSTLLSVTVTVSSNPATITAEHIIPLASGNGSSLAEWELLANSAAVNVNRTVTALFLKLATQQLTRTITMELTQD